MPTSGFYRLKNSIKAGLKRIKKFTAGRQMTEEEADRLIGPNRDARKLMKREALNRELIKHGIKPK